SALAWRKGRFHDGGERAPLSGRRRCARVAWMAADRRPRRRRSRRGRPLRMEVRGNDGSLQRGLRSRSGLALRWHRFTRVRDLGARGHRVDVFTRWREKDDPRIQPLGPNGRVIHIQSGPLGYWPKMAVFEHLDEFTEKLIAEVEQEQRSYDVIHAHYWLSAK